MTLVRLFFISILGLIVSLGVQAQEKLEQIVVVGTPGPKPLKSIGYSVTRIDAETIDTSGHLALMDILRSQAGIAVTNSGGQGKQSSLRIRGEEGFRTLLLWDGIKLSDPSAPKVMPQMEHMQLDGSIDNIQILRGPQGFSYGADAGGVISITSKTPQNGTEGKVKVQSGKAQSHVFSGFWGAASDQLSGLLSVQDLSTGGFNAKQNDLSSDPDGYQNTQLHSKFAVALGDQWTLTNVLHQVKGQSQYDGCYKGWSEINQCRSTFDQDAVRLEVAYESERQTQRLALNTVSSLRDDYAQNELSYTYSGDIKKLDYVSRYALNNALSLFVGSDWEEQIAHNVQAPDDTQKQLGAFIDAQWQAFDNTFLSLGSRWDSHDTFHNHESSRATLAQLLETQFGILKFRASGGEGFRAPSLYEINYNKQNNSAVLLKEEISQGVDLGVDFYMDNGVSLTSTVFEQTVQDEIAWDQISGAGYIQREGRARSKGMELGVEWMLYDVLQITAQLTRNFTQTSDDERPLRRPDTLASLGLHYFPTANWQMHINHRRSASVKDATWEIPNIVLPSYYVTDISSQWQIWSQWRVFFNVNNVSDEQYQEVWGYNTAGRNAHMGMEFTF